MPCDRTATQQHHNSVVWPEAERPVIPTSARPFAAPKLASTVIPATRCDEDDAAIAVYAQGMSLRLALLLKIVLKPSRVEPAALAASVNRAVVLRDP